MGFFYELIDRIAIAAGFLLAAVAAADDKQ
jgi:hypothetical protein